MESCPSMSIWQIKLLHQIDVIALWKVTWVGRHPVALQPWAKLSKLQSPRDSLFGVIQKAAQLRREGQRGRNSVREIEFDCCVCRVPLLTFAVGGLDYPGAVQVVGVKVRESRWQDGAGATVDVTSAQCCRMRGNHLETKRKMRGEKNQR